MTIITRMTKISRMSFIFEFDYNFDCSPINPNSLIKYYFCPVIILIELGALLASPT